MFLIDKEILLFNINLYYFRYFEPYLINHYNLINKLLKIQNIGKEYHKKYPTTLPFINLNNNLFKKYPKAQNEFIVSSKKQQLLKYSIINDINYICNTNNDYEICSEKFISFFIEKNYHIEQYPELMIENIKNDIMSKK
jgi:hypothetical protein